MEAEDNQGDTDDLWVTLSNMGYNKGLQLDEVRRGSKGTNKNLIGFIVPRHQTGQTLPAI